MYIHVWQQQESCVCRCVKEVCGIYTANNTDTYTCIYNTCMYVYTKLLHAVLHINEFHENTFTFGTVEYVC